MQMNCVIEEKVAGSEDYKYKEEKMMSDIWIELFRDSSPWESVLQSGSWKKLEKVDISSCIWNMVRNEGDLTAEVTWCVLAVNVWTAGTGEWSLSEYLPCFSDGVLKNQSERRKKFRKKGGKRWMTIKKY